MGNLGALKDSKKNKNAGADSTRAVNNAISGGLNFIDTADSYGTGRLFGQSEKLIGTFLDELPQKQLRSLI